MKTKTEDDIYYCYALLDPRKPGRYEYGPTWCFAFEPFYIGKGKGRRSEDHVRVALNTGLKGPKNNKIRKIIREGHEVVVVRTRSTTDEATAIATEIKLIETIGRASNKSGPLTNLTDGGDGVSGLIFSELSRKKHSASQRARFDRMTAAEKQVAIVKRRQTLLANPHIQELAVTNYKKAIAQWTEEQTRKNSEAKKAAWARRTPEQLAQREQRRLAALQNKSNTEKEAIVEKKQAAWANRSTQQTEQSRAKRAHTWANKPQQERDAINEARGLKTRARHEAHRRKLISAKDEKRLIALYNAGAATQMELAARYGVTQAMVSNIVRGKYV